MHEFSLCETLVETALSNVAATHPDARISRVRVVAGDLRQIVPENLQFAYETLTRGTAAEGSQLEIRTVPITCRCSACDWEGTIDDAVFMCPECNAKTLQTLTGKELYLESLEIETNE